MIDIALKDIEKYYGANHVLKGVTFEVKQGERVGLLGRNGAGKTTLFKIIAGVEKSDAGCLMIRKGAVIGLLDQIPEFPDGYTAYDVLYTAFEELKAIHEQLKLMEKLMAESADTGIIEKYGRLQQVFEAKNGYAVEESISRICSGLNIDEAMLGKKFGFLSGGEKTIVMLGKILLQSPDILLLDEPTNHLDINAVEWLEGFLKEYRGTAVVISHDRYFLDGMVGRIVDITGGMAEIYEGGYSYYAAEKRERYLRQLKQYEQEQKKIRQLETAAKNMHEWARLADNPAMHRRAFNIEKRIDRMEKTDKPVKEKRIGLLFNEYGFSGRDVITVRELKKSYSGRKVLDSVNFNVKSGERVAILGGNGSGKSTLIKCITGQENADSGSIALGGSIKYAYLEQIIAFEDGDMTVLETVCGYLRLGEKDARNLLSRYCFKGDDVLKTVKNLSGGEKSRLRLCLLVQKDVNLLLLDEPTNHLDIDSREALEEALANFSATIVFVSHDRYFINKFATRIAELKGGSITDYYGDYEFFRARKQEEAQHRHMESSKNAHQVHRSVRVDHRAEDNGRENKAGQIEDRIQELEGTLRNIAAEMQLCSSDYIRLDELFHEKTEYEKELEGLYEDWAGLVD